MLSTLLLFLNKLLNIIHYDRIKINLINIIKGEYKMHLLKHFITITKHRHKVMRYCFKVGLYKQGLIHDLSKYSFVEFFNGAKYYKGTGSPISEERKKLGFSRAWLHHKGRNKHHWEYWIDFTSKGIIAIEMPIKYVVEMFCDRVAATMVYRGVDFDNQAPLDYYNKTRFYYVINEKTDAILKDMLKHLANSSLDETIGYIKKTYLS